MDDLVSQVQMLETSKMKLEVELQQMKKEHRRELQGKEQPGHVRYNFRQGLLAKLRIL